MTPEEKQSFLQRWLPEIAKACRFDVIVNSPENQVWGTRNKDYDNPVPFDPFNDDRDSALVRRVLEIDVIWRYGYSEVTVIFDDWRHCSESIAEPHDGTPDSIGAAERWAVLLAAAKKLEGGE